jgi:hypothetical protein
MYQLPTDSTGCQLMPTLQFHRLPTDANPAVSRSAAVGGLATSGIGWQPVEPVGTRWNQLATSEISAKAWKTLQNPCKTPSYWWVVCKCVPVRVLHFANNQYEVRRLGEFAGSEKHAPHPVFICQGYSEVNLGTYWSDTELKL